MICNFVHAKLYLFVFDATFARIGYLLAYVAALLVASFWGF